MASLRLEKAWLSKVMPFLSVQNSLLCTMTRLCRSGSLVPRWQRLDAEHRAVRWQRRERLWQRRPILRQLIQLLEELDAVRHLARERAQNGTALLDRQLDEGHLFLPAAVGQDAPAGRTRVLDPVGLGQATDNIALAVHRQRRDRRAAQLAALSPRHREYAHGADRQAEALQSPSSGGPRPRESSEQTSLIWWK